MSDLLPEWAVSTIVSRAGHGITDSDVQQIVRSVSDSASFAFDQIKCRAMEAAAEYDRPSILLRPMLIRDGNQWCALYGENIQEGVAAFGDSPAAAFYAFDLAWHEKIAPASPGPGQGREEK